MLMLAVHCTLQRMERELYTEGHTHVRPKDTRHNNRTPLSPIETAISRTFDRLMLGDSPASPIPIEVPAYAIPL